MERFVILKKLSNEGVIKSQTEKDITLIVKKNVNKRWVFEQANKLSKFMKVRIALS